MVATNPNFCVNTPGYSGETTGLEFQNIMNGSSPSDLGLTADPSASASGGMSGMENVALGGTILSIGSAVSGIVSSCLGYATSKIQMQAQLDSTTSNLEHQDEMAKIQMETSLGVAQLQEQATADKVEGQKQYNAAKEECAKAENTLTVVKARIKEKEKTEKAGKLNTRAVDRLFRSKYSIGKPVSY